MNKPSETIDELIQEHGGKPDAWEGWRRKYGHLFEDVDIDSFLESIYESRGKKLPEYMRTKK